MRVYNHVPFKLEQHIKRLERSCSNLHIPFESTSVLLKREIDKALKECDHGELYLRLIITRGEGPIQLLPSKQEKSKRYIIITPIKKPDDSCYKKGVSVRLPDTIHKWESSTVAGAKVSNYVSNLLATHEIRNDAHEAIFLNPEGWILEGATSNLFIVKENSVLTPPLATPILQGVTRATILDLCKRSGVSTQERLISPQDLYTADEAFLTSSVREIFPIVKADDKIIGDGKPGKTTKKLLESYRLEVAALCGR